VEFHLAQILARLGVDTRTHIGDALAATPASARPSARPSDAPSPHTHMRPPPGPARTRPRPRRQ
jgi:hypothetical protein